ncbi:uncharacterized protein LOC119102396 [Pollicipes pollicipes]|uniref:uncharacterized protein LOC119102396 n=1 Tax=Pollicipes pollicipes TaxID=41117 RepID=UPI00188568B2|nr:uncharacterized protein LOC119102396 [Pollicipes pollicipes]
MAMHPAVLVIIVMCCIQPSLCSSQGSCQLDLQITNNGKQYDLSSVALQTTNVTGQWAGQPALASVRLCGPGSCPDGAAACLRDANSGQLLVSDAGRVDNSTRLVAKNSHLQLDLAPGGRCEDQGQATSFTTTLLFICQPEDSAQLVRADMGACGLLLMWHSPHACARPAGPPPACALLSHPPLQGLPGLAALDDLCGSGPFCDDDGAGHLLSIGSQKQPGALTAENGTVRVTYGTPGQDQAEISLLCRETAGRGRLVFRGLAGRLRRLDLESALLCPAGALHCQTSAVPRL